MERYCKRCGHFKEFNQELHEALKETRQGNGLGYGKNVGFISAHKCYDCHRLTNKETSRRYFAIKRQPQGTGMSIAQRIALNFPVSPTEIANVKSGKWTLDHVTHPAYGEIPEGDTQC